ncbi:biopolymer transporter ExbD [Pelagicoccus sp. SDUM812002]|uniref:ExbD/TolR family protein n=1 Tax=Pelagicoccus sp. SDUM812002 TaxID=3041266 RepID=UPI0028100FB1|nr:biopolymer transporter ExbD [Pelagicoccus sp. SDUM812002]MDQ8184053.1 biopolymer transporter ExbD [Pelagicoccus sp. SDUM812002]
MAVQLQSKTRSRKVAGVSMAPMIDMVFLLLVFFMTASAMSQAGSKLELDLPDSPEAKVAQDFSGRLILSIVSSGKTYVGNRQLDAEELSEVLVAFRESEPSAKLNIRAAKDTPFSAVKATMRVAAAAGIDDYLYATYQAGSN